MKFWKVHPWNDCCCFSWLKLTMILVCFSYVYSHSIQTCFVSLLLSIMFCVCLSCLFINLGGSYWNFSHLITFTLTEPMHNSQSFLLEWFLFSFLLKHWLFMALLLASSSLLVLVSLGQIRRRHSALQLQFVTISIVFPVWIISSVSNVFRLNLYLYVAIAWPEEEGGWFLLMVDSSSGLRFSLNKVLY